MLSELGELGDEEEVDEDVFEVEVPAGMDQEMLQKALEEAMKSSDGRDPIKTLQEVMKKHLGIEPQMVSLTQNNPVVLQSEFFLCLLFSLC